MKKVTLQDIANELNISKNSVSRALNDSKEISQKTKELVKLTASKMGYVRNKSASALRSGKSHLIAIVFSEVVNPYFSIMTKQLQLILASKNYDTVIFTTSNDLLDEKLLQEISARGVDAIISFMLVTQEVYTSLEKDIPLVLLGKKEENCILETFITDDYNGGEIAFDYLFCNGYKRLCYVGPDFINEASKRRYSGFYSKSTKKGLSVSRKIVDLNGHNNYELYKEISTKYDGIFFYNDVLALDFILSVDRKDIGVVGYDNIQKNLFSRQIFPSIDSNNEYIAKEVIDKVFAKINNKELPSKVNTFEVFISK